MKITKTQLKQIIKEELTNALEQPNEKPRINFYERPNGFLFSGGDGFGGNPLDVDDIAARLKEGGLAAGSESRDTGIVVGMGVTRGGTTEDYEDLMRRISERLKDNFSLTFKYSKDGTLVSKKVS